MLVSPALNCWYLTGPTAAGKTQVGLELAERIGAEIVSLDSMTLYIGMDIGTAKPTPADQPHPNDKRRIIRAWEVFRATGQPLSHQQTHFDEGRLASQCRVFVLSWPREELHVRIDARVEAMFAAGLVDEVRGLVAKYGSLSRTASQAVGYREVMEYLQAESEGVLGACID